jgi:hypothetical protein
MRAIGRWATTTVLVVGCVAALPDSGPVTPAEAQSPSGAPIASPATPAAAAADRLRERAAAFWAARVAGDSKAQWELLEPRGRGRLTPAEYDASGGAVKYVAYQVEDASIDGYFATVRVRIIAQPILPIAQGRKIGPASVVATDRWVRIRGIWYRSLEQEGGEPRSQ